MGLRAARWDERLSVTEESSSFTYRLRAADSKAAARIEAEFQALP